MISSTEVGKVRLVIEVIIEVHKEAIPEVAEVDEVDFPPLMNFPVSLKCIFNVSAFK